MPDVRCMCAIGRRGQLGLNGRLPWEGNKGPEFVADVARFFDMTRGHVIMAGPRTAASIPAFVRQERERYAEDIHVLRSEESRLLIHFIRRATEPTAYHLLAQQLRCERAQSHNVRHRLRVPPFREHSDRDHLLDLFAWFSFPSDRVNRSPQQFGSILL